MWAYKITDAKKFIDCELVGFGHESNTTSTFEASIYEHEAIPGTVAETYKQWLEELKEGRNQ